MHVPANLRRSNASQLSLFINNNSYISLNWNVITFDKVPNLIL